MDKQDFNEKFNELLASFNRSMTNEFKTVWFNKLKDLNYEIFCATVNSLVMKAEKLPTMPQFFAEYFLIKNQTTGQDRKGCLYCVNGFVLYERAGWGYKGPIAVAEACALCNPPRQGIGYDAKKNLRGYKLCFTPGPVVEETHDDRHTAMESFRIVSGIVANIGETVQSSLDLKEITEEEKSRERVARLRAMAQVEEEEKINYPYKDVDEIPF